jgi:hypothetical protein
MIERRKESRIRLSVPVKVSGVDDNGEPFAIEVMAGSGAEVERCWPDLKSNCVAETRWSWTVRAAELTFGLSGS